MRIRLNWTTESERTFNQNLEYLPKEWDVSVLNSFLVWKKYLSVSEVIQNYIPCIDLKKMYTGA